MGTGATVFVLAGGLGTRLAHAIGDVPKPMADIAGHPFLEWQLKYFIKHNFRDFVLMVGHKKEAIMDFFHDGASLGSRIRYSAEEELLGTGGAFLQALERFPCESFVLANGDTYFAIPIRVLLNHARERVGVSVGLKLMDRPQRYGCVRLGAGHEILAVEEKRLDVAEGYINGGIYAGETAVLRSFRVEKCSLENDLFPRLMKKHALLGIPFGGGFLDIGIPEDYYRGQSLIPSWCSQEETPALFLDRDGILIEDRKYEADPERLVFKEEGVGLFRRCLRKGWKLIIVSNQAGVAKGILPRSAVEDVNARIRSHFADWGVEFTDFYHCPFHADGKLPEFTRESLRRKPAPGMLLDAAERWRIDMTRSIMIGDKDSDMINLPYLRSFIIPGRYAIKNTSLIRSYSEIESLV